MKTWKVEVPASTEFVFLYLLDIFNDPHLSQEIALLSKDLYLKDSKHQEFHENLRTSSKDRWKKVNDLYQKKNYSQMSCIPVDFPLPYGANTWRAYKMTMKRIGFFRKGFLRINNGRGVRPMKVSESIDTLKTCNFDPSLTFNSFTEEVCEALGDFILFEGDDGGEWPEDWIPYLLREGGSNFLQIVN
jgi:hypothetical protein